MRKKIKEYDQNIIAALKKLKLPLHTFDGHEVYFDINVCGEDVYHHISDKKHHLHVVDINAIPFILKDKKSIRNDRNGKKYRTYIGRRGKTKEKTKYIKIVTLLHKNKKESIYTIYLIKNMN